MSQHSREDAYRLSTPEAHREYYDAWAPTYDADFIAARGYLVPTAIARAFRAHAGPGDTPIADIGCGTGQIGRALALPEVDGFDVSPAMLREAAGTGVYRHLYQVDLTGPSIPRAGEYGGLVSSGTFTHGHLGPASLTSILRLARPGALCAIGINADHFVAAGFASFLREAQGAGSIVLINEAEERSYAGADVADAAVNRTRIVVFRLTD